MLTQVSYCKQLQGFQTDGAATKQVNDIMKSKIITAATALLISTAAQASIVTFNTAIPVPNNFDGVYVNLLTGATGSPVSPAGWDFNPYNSGTSLSFFWNNSIANTSGGVASTTTGPYLDLAPGAVISPGSVFAQTTSSTATIPFKIIGEHILGFRFFNESTSSVNYGYLTLSVAGTTGFPSTITGWAFEDSGGAITVPTDDPATTPIPGALPLFATGLAGLGFIAHRRKRRSA